MPNLLTNIDKKEVARYLGCVVSPLPTDMETRIEKASEQIMCVAKPRVIYREFRFYNATFQLEGTCFQLQGDSAATYLKDATSCILLAATLGNEVDNLIRKAQITDMAEAVVLDSCASCAIENVCNNLEKQIETELFHSKNLYITDRFSPGYGDIPLTLQRDFCSVLDTGRKIGLSVNDSGLMTPIKSVTAIIGVAPTPQEKRITGCQNCLLKHTCPYRKGGTTCGKHNAH